MSQEDLRFMTFSLGGECYAFPLLAVREVIATPQITPVPMMPAYFLGFINLRGQVISVIDLRARFKIKPKSSEENAVIICDLDSTQIGMLVDSVEAVIHPSAAEVSERPEMSGPDSTGGAIEKIIRNSEKLIFLLNANKALSLEDKKLISNSQPKAA